MKNKNILILELGERFIKVCRFKSKTALNCEVFEFNREPTADDLREMFSSLAVPGTDKVIVSFTRLFFMIRFLEIPSRNPAEITKMLPFQLAKIAPFSLADVIYDFSHVDFADKLSKLVVFLIQNAKTAVFFEVLKEKKIFPAVFTISSEGLNRWLQFQEKLPPGVFAVIDIDKYCVEAAVVIETKVIFSRAFPYSRDEEINEGINQSLNIYNKKFPGQQISRIIFTGNRKESVIEKISQADAVFIDPEKKFSTGSGVTAVQEFSFASILGLTAAKQFQFDFCPDFVNRKRQKTIRQRILTEAVFIGAEVFMIAAVLFGQYIHNRKGYLNFLDSQLKEIRGEVKELDNITGKIKILDKEINKKTLFTEILHDIISSVPENTSLSLLDFQNNGEFSLKGHAVSRSDVFKLRTLLDNSRLFKKIEIKYAANVKQKNEVLVEFHIYGKVK